MNHFRRVGLGRYAYLRVAVFLVALPWSLETLLAEWSPFDPVPDRVAVPSVEAPGWQANPIDRFVYAGLEDKGLSPAEEVDRRTWLRRVTFDLTGLPPTPNEIESFVADPRSDETAYAAAVDRLLSSPHYGERWARHWLDVVRYADTDGFAIDGERPLLWRYRDYVIRMFNEDRPYDRFVREQIAGDEIEYGSEGIVASSFYRLGPYELDNMTPENRRQDFLNEMTSAIGSAFLGMTIGCARCHDHKYDPIPQSDFYRLQAFLQPYDRKARQAEFLQVELTQTVRQQQQAAASETARRKKARDEFRGRLRGELAKALGLKAEDVDDKLFEKAIKGEKIALKAPKAKPKAEEAAEEAPAAGEESECEEETKAKQDEKAKEAAKPQTFAFTKEQRDKLKKLDEAANNYDVAKRFHSVADALAATEKPSDVAATHVLENGDVFAKAARVDPGCLSQVASWSDELAARIEACAKMSSGRRRVLADWLSSAGNPLTPRVYVNRVWQHHFGVGIVATSNDFGANGAGPSHPELLDYLTRWFLDNQWRTKPLHRLIVLSRTYRSASQHDRWDACATVDPDNRLLWRAPLRRLEAEAIRDALLAVSGRLNTASGGPGFFDVLPDGMATKLPFFSWNPSPEDQRRRRSIYMFQRRNLIHPMMEAFDVADSSQPCERRGDSVTAAQSLALFNGKFVTRASRHLSARLAAEQPSDKARIQQVFLLAYGRFPAAAELADCERFLNEKRAHYAGSTPKPKPEKADEPQDAGLLALRDLCAVVLCSNEFLYLD